MGSCSQELAISTESTLPSAQALSYRRNIARGNKAKDAPILVPSRKFYQ
jgi:hypothetical protein